MQIARRRGRKTSANHEISVYWLRRFDKVIGEPDRMCLQRALEAGNHVTRDEDKFRGCELIELPRHGVIRSWAESNRRRVHRDRSGPALFPMGAESVNLHFVVRCKSGTTHQRKRIPLLILENAAARDIANIELARGDRNASRNRIRGNLQRKLAMNIDAPILELPNRFRLE